MVTAWLRLGYGYKLLKIVNLPIYISICNKNNKYIRGISFVTII